MKFYTRSTCLKQMKLLNIPGSDILDNMKHVYLLSLKCGMDEANAKRIVGQYRTDALWTEAKKPYFNIWPKIQESFIKTSLDIPGNRIHLPLSTILIRFSEKEPLRLTEDLTIRSVLVGEVDVNNFDKHDATFCSRGLAIWTDVGETHTEHGLTIPVYTYAIFPLTEMSVENSLKEIQNNYIVQESGETVISEEENMTMNASARVVMSLCLLGINSDLIVPDVLTNDLLKYRRTFNPAYVFKAHRKGKIGWHVGRDVEVSPHFRRPHFGIRWTGEGSKIPRLVPIKGSVINRHKLETVPTGYLEKEENDA